MNYFAIPGLKSGPKTGRNITPEYIVKTVCEYYNIDPAITASVNFITQEINGQTIKTFSA